MRTIGPAAPVRITARLPLTHLQLAKIIDRTGLEYLTAAHGLAPRALRDLQATWDAGRFTISDPVLALACAGGA